MISFPALITNFPVNIFCNIEGPKVSNTYQEVRPVGIFISCFTVSLTPSSNTTELSSNLMNLMISSITPFKMDKVICFPVLTTPYPLAIIFSIPRIFL